MNCFKMIKLLVIAGCIALVTGLSGCVMVVTNPDPYQEHYQTIEVDYVHVRPGSIKNNVHRPSHKQSKPVVVDRKPVVRSDRPHRPAQPPVSKTDFNQVIEGWICKIQNREWFN